MYSTVQRKVQSYTRVTRVMCTCIYVQLHVCTICLSTSCYDCPCLHVVSADVACIPVRVHACIPACTRMYTRMYTRVHSFCYRRCICTCTHALIGIEHEQNRLRKVASK